MARIAVLAGVAHDIAHHASSGLSYISPHLALALREAQLKTTDIDLLDIVPYPLHVAEHEPLRLSMASLGRTAQAILGKHGFSSADVSSMVLHATPAAWDRQGYVLHTRVTITSRSGKQFDSGWLG
jgi:hypothetical protein